MQPSSKESAEVAVRSSFVPAHSVRKNVTIAAIIFVAAHLALMVGLTTPEKFVFDEVHYVPAARQMLEPVMPQPMLNPMHPPLAKQIIALSIRSFGDTPLGWRYPSVLFGSLAIVAVYLCGLALFAGLQIQLAQAVERPYCPYSAGCFSPELKRDRFGPCPKQASKHVKLFQVCIRK